MINKFDAIFATHSNVVTIRGDVAYDKDENIVEYNVNHLNSMPNKEIDDFVEKYGT